jgi:hypothetical protein
MNKPTIPILIDPSPDLSLFARSVKTTLDSMTGKQRDLGPLDLLDLLEPGATLEDLVVKVNEVIVKMNEVIVRMQ